MTNCQIDSDMQVLIYAQYILIILNNVTYINIHLIYMYINTTYMSLLI